MRVRDGHIEFWADHQGRLAHSIDLTAKLCLEIEALARPLQWSALRLEVKADQSLQILKRDLSLSKEASEKLPNPAKLALFPIDRPRLSGQLIKTSNYAEVLKDLSSVQSQGFDDLVYVLEDIVYEASFSNLFIVTQDLEIIAPKPRPGILEGICLKNFLATANARGHKTSRGDLGVKQMLQAKIIGLTNCLRGIRLAAFEENSYDNGEFFQQWIQPIVDEMYEKDRR